MDESSIPSPPPPLHRRRIDSLNMEQSVSTESVDSEQNMVPAEQNSTDDQNEDSGNSSASILGSKNAVIPLKTFTYRPSVPAHRRIRQSPLSSNAIFHQSHAGLFNLCVVVLVAVNGRLILENLLKHGLLIGHNSWFTSRSLRDWPLLMCCLSLPVFPLASFSVEKLAHQKHLKDPVPFLLHTIITSSVIVYPISVILGCDSAVLSGVILMLFASTVWLKLISFAHTNYDMRVDTSPPSSSSTTTATTSTTTTTTTTVNLTLKGFSYFMLAPTLCYQTDYPRTSSVRKSWVFRQAVKLLIFTGFMGFIVEQYINPIVKNSQHPLNGDLLNAAERVLKLSLPILYLWLCMFYCFFHLWLNILAEFLRFGDREFYRDWWNAKSVGEYWRMWNTPVHKWIVRHVYFPCIRHGMPKSFALLNAFLLSALFHELCIAVPCHLFKLWAFIGIMFQIPLVVVTNYLQQKFNNSMVGNMMFWFFFCIVGQPMCVLLYYHDVMNRREGSIGTPAQ